MRPRYSNILLINAWDAEVFPPPAIGYLQAAIKDYFKGSVSVAALDLKPAIAALSAPNNFDLIAVTFHSFSVRYAKTIREAAAGKHLICGGHHPSALPEQLLTIGYDQVVIGQGENAIIDIVLGNDTNSIISKPHEHYNINTFPTPHYGGLFVQNSLEYGYPIITSRGCPFKCNFCASSLFWNRKTYLRSPESVLCEIKSTIDIHKGRMFFEDDNFTMSKSRAMQICEGIKNMGINAKWQCGSRAESLMDERLVHSLISAGCQTVWIGVESLSQEALNRCEKNTTVEKMISGINTAERLGLRTMCQFIVGMPGDTEKDILITANAIRKLNVSRWGCNIAWILPNTNIHNEAVKHGFSNDAYLNGSSLYYTYEQPMETLQKWVQIINNAKSL